MHEAYNWKEEVANAVTHGIGFLLSIPALVMLIVFAVQRDNPIYLVSFFNLWYFIDVTLFLLDDATQFQARKSETLI